MTAARALVLATAVFARVCWKMQTNYEEELRRMGEDRDIERREGASGDGLPPVPALIGPVDADAFAKLEAVAARAAHCAVINTGPGMTGWAQAEYVENEVRAALRAFVSPPAGSAAAAQGPDLVSRMIDARNCLKAQGWPRVPPHARDVAGALRWLDEGIEEGMVLRELREGMRAQLSAEPHVCSCGHSRSCEGCSVGFEDRCRFEKALRTVLGVSS